jgi:TRAP-type C4-dicarboxylate transport system substrate-binding protein
MKMKAKRMGLWSLVGGLVCLLLAGCGGGNKEAVGDKPQPIKLKYAHHNPPSAFVCTQGMEVWNKAIEKKANGKVKIDLYPSATLGKPQDSFDLVQKGIADITWGYTAYMPGRFPLSEVLNLPMLGIDTAANGSKIIWDLYNNTPYLKKEFAGVKVLFLHTHDSAPVISKKPIYSIEDMQGKKLRSSGGSVIPMLQALGASPMAIPMPDTYHAAEKGVVEGAVLPWEAIEMLNLHEVFKYAMDANLYSGTFFVIMNQQKWDSLPEDVKKAFEEESGAKGAKLYADAWDQTKTVSTDKFLKAGGTLKAMDPAETIRWQEKAKVIWEKWANDLEAKGLPGKAVLAETQQLIKKYIGK